MINCPMDPKTAVVETEEVDYYTNETPQFFEKRYIYSHTPAWCHGYWLQLETQRILAEISPEIVPPADEV